MWNKIKNPLTVLSLEIWISGLSAHVSQVRPSGFPVCSGAQIRGLQKTQHVCLSAYCEFYQCINLRQTLYICSLVYLGNQYWAAFVSLNVSFNLVEWPFLLWKSLKDPALDFNLKTFDCFAIMISVKTQIQLNEITPRIYLSSSFSSFEYSDLL